MPGLIAPQERTHCNAGVSSHPGTSGGSGGSGDLVGVVGGWDIEMQSERTAARAPTAASPP